MTIELSKSELLPLIGNQPFLALPFNVQRNVASKVLNSRGDDRSLRLAYLLQLNNPNLNNFAVIDDL